MTIMSSMQRCLFLRLNTRDLDAKMQRICLIITSLVAFASVVQTQTSTDVFIYDRFDFNFRRRNATINTRPQTAALAIGPDPGRGAGGAPNFSRFPVDPPSPCPPSRVCPSVPERFYTTDGGCNNLLDGSRGQVGRPHKRLVPADYADGIGEPRVGIGGRDLPSARVVSTTMQEAGTRKSPKHTHMVVIWGQYLTHDITDTPTISRLGVDCSCGNRDTACFNIRVPINDIQYRLEGKPCLPLVRSQPVRDAQCNDDVRQQVNSISPYIDAGTVYGNSDFHLRELLNIGSATLKTGNLFPHGHSPPNAPSLPLVGQVHHSLRHVACPADVHRPQGTETCFVAGDERANENPALASMHTLFVRMHNRVVGELRQENPSMTTDELVKVGRMIVAAVTQRITYKEYLPEVLGEDYMKRFGLNVVEQGYYYGYDASVDATTSNGFSTAALRSGHTLVTSPLTRQSGFWRTQGAPLHLRDNFFSSVPLLRTTYGGANSILRGLCVDSAETADSTFVDDLHNFLFAPEIPGETGVLGHDLLSINIQRGRDHGLPGYNTYREFCGLKKARTFSDFIEIPVNRRNKLATLYSNRVDDVDLYIAAISESPQHGGLFGPILSCLLAQQYRDFKNGDRLWHENGGDFAVFTPDQLASIRQYSLARLLCDDLNDMNTVQPNPFQRHTYRGQNDRRYCDHIRPLDLRPWYKNRRPSGLNTGTSTESTQWFPAVHGNKVLTPQALLCKLRATRPDDVCAQASGWRERVINGDKQYRYDCPPGSIKGTDYPSVDASKGRWSSWEDASTPSRDGDDDETRSSIDHPCSEPLAIQVFTTRNEPARTTGDVFKTFSPSAGFLCLGNHQQSGRCQDYQVRYFCESIRQEDPTTTPTPPYTTTTVSGNVWTRWISRDDPRYEGDFEYLTNTIGLSGFCHNPIQIQGRTVIGHVSAPAYGNIVDLSPRRGLICRNSNQIFGRCWDYEVRYLCRARDLRG